jgi:hypothetical protein
MEFASKYIYSLLIILMLLPNFKAPLFCIFRYRSQAPSMPIWTTDGPCLVALDGVEVDAKKTTMFERRFNPYDFNGG